MLNDLKELIESEIELKIRNSTIYSKDLLPNYFILLQLYINSTLNSLSLFLSLRMITRLVDQCFLFRGEPTPFFFFFFQFNLYIFIVNV